MHTNDDPAHHIVCGFALLQHTDLKYRFWRAEVVKVVTNLHLLLVLRDGARGEETSVQIEEHITRPFFLFGNKWLVNFVSISFCLLSTLLINVFAAWTHQ
jgi:hypothetical protein